MSKAKAFIYVDRELDLYLLGLRELDVTLQLLNQAVLLLHLQLQVSIVLLELADDERLGEVMALVAGGLRAECHAFSGSCWLRHLLLQAQSQLLKFFVSLIELVLDLLQLGLEARVLVLRYVVGDFEVPVVILKVFLLHLHEVVEGLRLRMLLGTKYHLSQLLPLHLVQLLRIATVQDGKATERDLLRRRTLRHHVGHDVPAHWPDTVGHLLLHQHAISLIHLLLRAHPSKGLLRHRHLIAVRLLALVLHHEILLLDVVRRLPVLCACLRLSLFERALGLALPVFYLVRLGALVAVLVVLVVYHKNGIIVLLVWRG